MTDLLAIGASGLRAYQTALTTSSENVANAGVSGYSRRTTNLTEISAPGSSLLGGRLVNGLGVAATGITRAADEFRASEVRSATTDLAKTQSGIVWLDSIERALTGNRLGDSLTRFFGASENLAADPASQAARVVFLDSASGIAGGFVATDRALATAAIELDATAAQSTRDLNGTASSLAQVNSGLARVSPGTSGHAALLDQRDRLLENLAEQTDIDVAIDEYGRASVRLNGATGPILVEDDNAGQLRYERSGGATAFTLYRNATASIVTPTGGILAGVAEGAIRIDEARTGLDALATQFVNDVNAVQAAGEGLDGNPGAPMFAIGAGGAGEVSVLLTDPSGVAAAQPGGGARDNRNLQAIAALRDSSQVEGRVNSLILGNASALEARKSVSAAQTVIRDQAVTQRDSVTGVNLDEEAVDLLRFQQAYQASSRVIQVARETLQTIFDIG